ncbi:MAG: N-acyl-D-amino-acid deacylase [Halioglobus sp.]|jgi:N-acyl-D-amino-acid deacylase
MTYDLKIVGGTIVDGTGESGYRGDVGISQGRIVALGDAPDDATTTIDATDRIVSPGFVDIHTHYDAQIIWDRSLSISPWHGVTTAVIGNCGFGISPMRPEHRKTAMRTLEKVEGMSFDALSAGLGEDWPFTTFPEYLQLLENKGSGINVAAFIGHTPLRLWVMGEEATEREATEEETQAMAELVREAMAAGAIGFSSSQAATHHGDGGKPVPSRLAAFEEIDALVGAMAESGRGIFQAAMGRTLTDKHFTKLAENHGIAITWTALLADMVGPGSHKRYLESAAVQQAGGLNIVPQVACRPIMFDFNFDQPYPFEQFELFQATMQADLAGKLAAYGDPQFREDFKAQSAADAKNVNAGWAQRTEISRYDPDPSLENRTLVEVAAAKNIDPIDLALDMAIETNLQSRIRFGFLNHNEVGVEELITNDHTVITLSDAGAHADQLCDACYGTHLLGYWVREKNAMSIERAIYALTQRPAQLVGLKDRGHLAQGLAADIVIFDPETVGASSLKRTQDLPGNAERLVADALGVDAVIVNGVVLRQDGEDQCDSSTLPGKVLRAGAAAVA